MADLITGSPCASGRHGGLSVQSLEPHTLRASPHHPQQTLRAWASALSEPQFPICKRGGSRPQGTGYGG